MHSSSLTNPIPTLIYIIFKQIEETLHIRSLEWASQTKAYEKEIQSLKGKIIVYQHESQKEANNGIVMLREVEGWSDIMYNNNSVFVANQKSTQGYSHN